MICKSNRIVLALVILLNGSWHDTLAHIQYYFPFISIEDWPHYSPSIPTVFNPHKAPAQASYRKTTNKKVIQIRNGTEDKPVQRLACLQPDYSCFLFGQEESKLSRLSQNLLIKTLVFFWSLTFSEMNQILLFTDLCELNYSSEYHTSPSQFY